MYVTIPSHITCGRDFFVQPAEKEKGLFDMAVFCIIALRFAHNSVIIMYRKGGVYYAADQTDYRP